MPTPDTTRRVPPGPLRETVWVVTDLKPTTFPAGQGYQVTPEGIDEFLGAYLKAGGVEVPTSSPSTTRRIDGPDGTITIAELWIYVRAGAPYVLPL